MRMTEGWPPQPRSFGMAQSLFTLRTKGCLPAQDSGGSEEQQQSTRFGAIFEH
jgi:hypothetical protein